MTNGNPSGGKISWRMIAYSVIALVILYNLYPNSDGVSGGIGETFLALLLVLGIIIGVSVAVFVYKTFFVKSSKKKTDETDKKGTKTTVSVPRKVTFWTDWKTYITIFLGYILWEIWKSQQFFNHRSFHSVMERLPDGMLYLPIMGIVFAILLGIFVYLALHSKSPFVVTFGLVFGCICVLAGLFNSWFLPYGEAHTLCLPLLQYFGGAAVQFPADPIISSKWIALGVIFTFILVKAFPKKATDSDIAAVMVLVIAAVMFIPQLLN